MTKFIKNEIARASLSHLMGKVVGKMRLNKPETYTRQFECAAWYETSEAKVGVVVDLVLVEEHLSSHDIYLEAIIPANITSDYFQSLWCGSPIGGSYDTNKNVGNATEFRFRVDILDAILRTGVSPFKPSEKRVHGEHDIFVDRQYWGAFENYYRMKLGVEKRYMLELIAKHETGDGGEYRSTLTSLGYCGNKIKVLSDTVDKICTHMSYQKEGSMFRQYYTDNTSWVNV